MSRTALAADRCRCAGVAAWDGISAGWPMMVVMTRQLIDLTHPLHDGLDTHPGLPSPKRSVFRSREQYEQSGGMPFQIDRVDLVGNTGTWPMW